MKPLGGLDGAFLHRETPHRPMHVAALHLFELPAGDAGDFHADVKRQMRRRLHPAPIFGRNRAPRPLQFAHHAWVHDEAVDLEFQVRRVTLPAPGGQAELEACAARLHGELLHRSRPWWRLCIIDGPAGVMPPVANLVISDLPGPQRPLHAAGARMRACWPLSIPEHGLGLNPTVMSDAGATGLGFTTAAVAVPHARALADALVEADGELRSCSRPHAPPRQPANGAVGV